MPGDFEDDVETIERGATGETRLHATVSVGGLVVTKLLPASGQVTIGRSPGSDLVIPHDSISRHHATLRMSPLEIIDAGSRNGTCVRGKAVTRGVPVPIAVGDGIQLGEAALLIQSVVQPTEDKPVFDERRSPLQNIDTECARSARTGSPFGVVQIVTHSGRPGEVMTMLRGLLRTTDTVKNEGTGYQVLLVDTGGDQVMIAVERIRELLRKNGIEAQLGVARFPHEGVSSEQLIAHALEQLARGPDDEPTPMDHVREVVHQVAPGELSVLIAGETGVGKELCAEMIHRLSPRAAKPFVKLNCSALVESLIESELFGHERGAFTGATTAHPGLLETGDGGTVFLDEIGELPLGVQSKLLRVLEERVVRRVGATAGRKVDVRFICATNRDLADEVNAGRFRRDLYYRINGVTISIPPLRERRREIVPLARVFASRVRSAPLAFGREVVSALESHSWPGNIRELRNTVERAMLLSSGGSVRPSHLVLEPVRDGNITMPIDRISAERLSSERLSSPTLPLPPPAEPRSLPNAVADLERQRILDALEQCGGNQTRAARALGISRNTLLARLDEYGLPRPRKP